MTNLWDGPALARQKAALPNDTSVQNAVAALREVADRALTRGPYSVINKTILPASGDVHDYFSTASYFWPCTISCTKAISKKLNVPCQGNTTGWCDKTNDFCNWTAANDPSDPPAYPCNASTGEPWQSHTGFSNTALPGLVSDRTQIDGVWNVAMPLILYAWYTGSAPHQQRAAHLLRTFFLDNETKMNPALNFAQSVPGAFDGVSGGLVDFNRFSWLLDAIILLEDSDPSGAVWTAQDRSGMDHWVEAFLHWFASAPIALSGLRLRSNIAIGITVDDMAMSLFLSRRRGGDAHHLPPLETKFLQHLARNQSKTLVNRLIGAAGNFPYDDDGDPDSFGYHTGNVIEFMEMAQLTVEATVHNSHDAPVNLFDWTGTRNQSLHEAMLWLAPYCASNGTTWPYPNLRHNNPWLSRCRMIYRQAANQWQDHSWEALAQDMSTAPDDYLTFGLDMRSFTELLYPSTLGDDSVSSAVSSHHHHSIPSPSSSSSLVIAALATGRSERDPPHGDRDEQQDRIREEAAQAALLLPAFYFDAPLVDGVVLRSNPQVPVISGVAPPGAMVTVVQWCQVGQIGPRVTTADPDTGKFAVAMRDVTPYQKTDPNVGGGYWSFVATCCGGRSISVDRVLFAPDGIVIPEV